MSCKPNPGKGGFWYVVLNRHDIKISEGGGFYPATTNNKLLLDAILTALKTLPKNSEIKLYTNSTFLVNTVKGLGKWQENGLENHNNHQLLDQLLNLFKHYIVSAGWIADSVENKWLKYCYRRSNEIRKSGEAGEFRHDVTAGFPSSYV